MDWNAFTDELQKIARVRRMANLGDEAMRAIVGRLDPTHVRMAARKSGVKLKEVMRKALHTDPGVHVPLKERLKSFKHWKKTGKVPEVHSDWEGVAGLSPRAMRREFLAVSPSGRQMEYSRAAGTRKLYSGGTEEGLRAAVKDPKTYLDQQFLVPGQAKAQLFGLYAHPQVEGAGRYVGRSRLGGKPGIAELDVPISQTLSSANEVMIPRGSDVKLTRMLPG